MIESLAEPTVEWLAEPGAPNGLVLLFALTQPARWTNAMVAVLRRRIGGTGGDGAESGDRSA